MWPSPYWQWQPQMQMQYVNGYGFQPAQPIPNMVPLPVYGYQPAPSMLPFPVPISYQPQEFYPESYPGFPMYQYQPSMEMDPGVMVPMGVTPPLSPGLWIPPPPQPQPVPLMVLSVPLPTYATASNGLQMDVPGMFHQEGWIVDENQEEVYNSEVIYMSQGQSLAMEYLPQGQAVEYFHQEEAQIDGIGEGEMDPVGNVAMEENAGNPVVTTDQISEIRERGRTRTRVVRHRRHRSTPTPVCGFCKSNGEAREIWTSHATHDQDGKTTCPVLGAYVCPLCKETGENGHTVKYCSLNNGQIPGHVHIRSGRNAAGRVGRYRQSTN